MRNLKTLYLLLSDITDLSPIMNAHNRGLMYPDCSRISDSSAVPYIPELIKCSITTLDLNLSIIPLNFLSPLMLPPR